MASGNFGLSGGVGLLLGLLLLGGMGLYRGVLGGSQAGTIVGGVLGGHVFLFVLTGISGLEREFFGDGFQVQPGSKWRMIGSLVHFLGAL